MIKSAATSPKAKTRKSPALSTLLLRWYRRRGRELPWRRRSDPYSALVSEAMLQQTTVSAVIPYYERWMRVFPDVKTLAEADRDHVMKMWEGLGYYSRAVSLHKAAGMIAHKRQGRFPENEDHWRKLPGVGAYTAAALAAIVSGQRVVAIDGLARRVLFRFLGMTGNAQNARAVSKMREEGLILIAAKRPGDSVQAIMDLATAVCTKNNPRCDECPVSRACAALAAGDPGRLPAIKRKKIESIEVAVGLWVRGETVYMQRRPDKGLFAGLWELPGGKVEKGETPEQALVREFQEELHRRVRPVLSLSVVRHSYTSFKVRIHPFVVRGVGQAPKSGDGHFIPLDKIGDYAQPAANKKIWRDFFQRKGS